MTDPKFSASVIPREVQPLGPDEEPVAKQIRQAYANNLVFDIKLAGKYSNGAAIALDPEQNTAWLLKPEVSKQSPAAGVNDLPVSKSKREAAFSDIARQFVSEDQFAKVAVIYLDGHETAAIELADTNFKNIPFLQKLPTGPQGVKDIFKDHQDNGDVWKWAFLDYVLGNTDRHSNNILIDPETEQVKLIDHGGAFAGEGFNPGGDTKTFVPYYLRTEAPKGFNTLPPAAKLRYLAKPSPEQEQEFLAWMNLLDEQRLSAVLNKYGIDEAAFKERFNQLKNAKNSIGLMLKLWVKPKESLTKAEPEEKTPWFLDPNYDSSKDTGDDGLDLEQHRPLSDSYQKQVDSYYAEVKENPYGGVKPPLGVLQNMPLSEAQYKKFWQDAPIEAFWGPYGSTNATEGMDQFGSRDQYVADVALERFPEAMAKYPGYDLNNDQVRNSSLHANIERTLASKLLKKASENGIIKFFDNSNKSDTARPWLSSYEVLTSLRDPKPNVGEKFKNWAMRSAQTANYLPPHLAHMVTPEEFHRVIDQRTSDGWNNALPVQALLDAKVGPEDRTKLFNAMAKQNPAQWASSMSHGLGQMVRSPEKLKRVGSELMNHPMMPPDAMASLGSNFQIPMSHEQIQKALPLTSAPIKLIANQLRASPTRTDLDHYLTDQDIGHIHRELVYRLGEYPSNPEHTALLNRLASHPGMLTNNTQKFWNDYESGVEAHHFATVQKYHNGTDEDVALTGFRRDEGHSSRYPGVHKGIPLHAKAVQSALLADPRAAIKHIDGKPHILVYRGVSGEYGHKIKQALDSGADDVQIPNAQFSSWTTKQGIARSFSDRSIRGQNSASVIMRKWMPVEDLLHSGVHKVSEAQDHVHPHESELIFQHKQPFMTIPKEDIQHTLNYHTKPTVNRFEPHDKYLVEKHGFPVPKQSYSSIGHLIKPTAPDMGPVYDKAEVDMLANELSDFDAPTKDAAGDDSEVWEKT